MYLCEVIKLYLHSRTDRYNRRFSECNHIKVLFKFYSMHLIIKQFPSDELVHLILHSCQLLLGRSYSHSAVTFLNYLSVLLRKVKGT